MKLTKVKKADYIVNARQIVFSNGTVLNNPYIYFTQKSRVYHVEKGYVVITKTSRAVRFIDHFDEYGSLTDKLDWRVCLGE